MRLQQLTAIRYRVLRHKFRQLLAGSVCAVTICEEYAGRQLAVAARNHNARHNSARLSCLLHSFAGSGGTP